MAAEVGKRYASAGGAELIVTKGGPGTISDGDTPLALKGTAPEAGGAQTRSDAPVLPLGKRYKSADGSIEVLVIKAGPCDLQCEGKPMELLQPKVLPSAD